jgi:hypothetical protein
LHGIGCGQDDAIGTGFSERIFECDPLLLEMVARGLRDGTSRLGTVQSQTIMNIWNAA